MFRNRRALTLQEAEALAAQGLAFLAEDTARLGGFLATTGVAPNEIRELVNTPQFLAAVLDHLTRDESLLLVFAANASIAPEAIAPALALLQQASGAAGRS